jgi:hypothetical protein
LKEIQEAIDDNCTGSLIAHLGADGSIPLHRAVEMLHLPAVKALAAVVDVNAVDKFQCSALDVCAQRIFAKQMTPPYLLSGAETPSPQFHPTLFDTSPASARSGFLFGAGTLGYAANPIDVAKVLLAAGAQPRSALLVAAQCADPEFGHLLLDAGADARERDEFSRTALWFAVQQCPSLVERLLVTGANPRIGPEAHLPVDVATSEATRRVLLRAARWYDIRLFIWIFSRGQVGTIDVDQLQHQPRTRMLGDVLAGVVFRVLPFLTDVDVARI